MTFAMFIGLLTFKPGDRVMMRSGTRAQGGEAAPMLHGIVETWGPGLDKLLVIWDNWPLVTELPNPNVQREGPLS